MNNSGRLLTAFAAGAVTGVVLGILFAPDKGSETRRKIRDAGKKLADGCEKSMRKGKEKLSGLKGDFRDKMETTAERMKEYV
jgi:gas vesicle protein